MAKHCGAKTRAGGLCKAPAMANGRCRVHGGASTGPKNQKGNSNAVKHGFYSDALRPDERALWERVEIGSIDDEIRLMRVKLHRLVTLSGNADVASLVESAIEVTRKQGEEFDHDVKGVIEYDKLELKAKAARYGDLIIQAVETIRKLELQRVQMQLLTKKIAEDGGGDGDRDVAGFEVVPYDE